MMTLTETQIDERTKAFNFCRKTRQVFLMAKAYKAKASDFAFRRVAKHQFTLKLDYAMAQYVYDATGILFEVA